MYALLAFAQDISFSSITRLLAVAENLSENGWKCSLWANPEQISKLPSIHEFDLKQAPSISSLSLCSYPITSMDDLMTGLGLTSNLKIEEQIESCCEAIYTFHPKVLIADLSPLALIAAYRLHIPTISTFRWTYHPDNPVNKLHSHPDTLSTISAIVRVCRRYKVDASSASELILRLPNMLIVPSIPPFEIGLTSDGYVWTGPLFSYMLENREIKINPSICAEHRVYVYLDPANIHPDYQCDLISKAFCNSNWHVVITLPLNYQVRNPLPKNVEVQFIVPGHTMITWSDVYITHGGANSLLLALKIGKPVVVIPGDSEERMTNAIVLKKFGLAIIIESEAPKPEEILRACESAISLNGNNKGKYWQSFMRESPGASAIQCLINNLIESKK